MTWPAGGVEWSSRTRMVDGPVYGRVVGTRRASPAGSPVACTSGCQRAAAGSDPAGTGRRCQLAWVASQPAAHGVWVVPCPWSHHRDHFGLIGPLELLLLLHMGFDFRDQEAMYSRCGDDRDREA